MAKKITLKNKNGDVLCPHTAIEQVQGLKEALDNKLGKTDKVSSATKADSATKASKLITTTWSGIDVNNRSNSEGVIEYHSMLSDTTPNMPTASGWQNAVMSFGLLNNGVTAQMFFAKDKPLYYRSSHTGEWQQIAYKSDVDKAFNYLGYNLDLNEFYDNENKSGIVYVNIRDGVENTINAPERQGSAVNFGAGASNFQLFSQANSNKLYHRNRWWSDGGGKWTDWKQLRTIDDKVTTSHIADAAITPAKIQTSIALNGTPSMTVEPTTSSPDKTIASVGLVKEVVDGIEIGGTNLILNSDFSKGVSYWSPFSSESGVVFSVENNTATFTVGASTSTVLQTSAILFEVGQKYTVSFDCRSDEYTTLDYIWLIGQEGQGNKSLSPSISGISSEWNRIVYTFTSIVNGLYRFGFGANRNKTTAGSFQLRNVKIEKGNKATAWSPSPEDSGGEIDTRNLLLNSKEKIITGYSGSTHKHTIFNLPISVKKGDVLTFNCDSVENISGDATEYTVLLADILTDSMISYRSGVITADNRVISLLVTADSDNVGLALYAGKIGDTSSVVKYTNLTLVKGNKPMLMWQAAPEDVQSQIDSKLGKEEKAVSAEIATYLYFDNPDDGKDDKIGYEGLMGKVDTKAKDAAGTNWETVGKVYVDNEITKVKNGDVVLPSASETIYGVSRLAKLDDVTSQNDSSSNDDNVAVTPNTLWRYMLQEKTDIQEQIDGKLGKTEKAADSLLADVARNVSNGAITQSKIGDGSVTTSKIAKTAVTSTKIENDVMLNGTPSMTVEPTTSSPDKTIASVGLVKKAVENIEIGGTNLLRYIKDDGSSYWESRGTCDVTITDNEVIRCNANGSNYPRIMNASVKDVNWESNTHYVLSYYARGEGNYTRILCIADINASNSILPFSGEGVYTSEWKKYIISFTTPSVLPNIEALLLQIYCANIEKGDTTSWLEIKDIKIERGNKATDWSPAPGDIQTAITNAVDYTNDAIDKIENGQTVAQKANSLYDDDSGTYKNWGEIDSAITEKIGDQFESYATKQYVDNKVASIGTPGNATETGAGIVRAATQAEVAAGHVSDNDPSEMAFVRPETLENYIDSKGFATTSDISSAVASAKPAIFFQAAQPAGGKDGDIWIIP